MKEFCPLSKKELEFMGIFWESSSALSRQDILDRAAQRECSWKPNSIHILLNSLLEKGFIRVAGYYIKTKKVGRTFEAAITREKYAITQVRLAVKQGESVCGQRLPWMDKVVAALSTEK